MASSSTESKTRREPRDSDPWSGPRLQTAVRALRHRNFRLYFFGMLVSFCGTWMQNIAQSWLVYRLTGSAWLLGLTGFASQIPSLPLGPFGGVLADRNDRKKIIIVTQTLSMLQAFVLAYLTMSGRVTYPMVLVLALLLGFVNAFDMPARHSYLIELVERDDLMNAIALNSSMFNLARVVGPAIAGLVIGIGGEGVCFLVNGVSFLAVLGCLFLIRSTGARFMPATRGSALSNVKEGLAYALRNQTVISLLALVAVAGLFGTSYSVLMPIFADRVLGGGARELGILFGASGVGALLGAITLALRRRTDGLEKVVLFGLYSFSASVIVFALSRIAVLSTVAIGLAGYTIMLQLATTNTLVQMVVPDELRGRVLSLYAASVIGLTPPGSLIAGLAADHIGAQKTVAIAGLLCLAGAAVFGKRLMASAGQELAKAREASLDNVGPEDSISPEVTL